MSYLSSLRLHFTGQFQADTTTANNDPQHFDTEHFRSNYQLLETATEANGWWNPRGTGAWRFRNCNVTRVCYRDGTDCIDPTQDPVVGALINDSESRAPGRLVDLDSQQQMVSEIWGFQILLKPAFAGMPSVKPLGFTSNFKVAPFADIWARLPGAPDDTKYSAMYQSVLEQIVWSDNDAQSRFLQELTASGAPKRLSIKFVVDSFNMIVTDPGFTFGRVAGTIGLCEAGEPEHFVAGRCLAPASPPPASAPNPFQGPAYAQLDGSTLFLDLGNSLLTASLAGPNADNGELQAALLPANGTPVLLGKIDYLTPDFYANTAGIVALTLTPTQRQLAATTPLGLVQLSPGGPIPQLAEAPNGLFLRADNFVYRLNPGEHADAKIYVTTFGRRTGGQKVSFGYDATMCAPTTGASPGAPPPPPQVGTPTAALKFHDKKPLTTGTDGTLVLTMTAGDPKHPRGYIDGQVYGICYGPGTTAPAPGSASQCNQIINLLIWSGYKAPKKPSWLHDVRPIFLQYANLYPVMLPLFNMADYASVVSRRQAMLAVFSMPMAEPNYMPVTRDMSEAKRAMVRQWLSEPQPRYMRLDSLEDLRVALQLAVELEHSTIPPYLCALYSIKPGCNKHAAEAIRSVAVEEMLHMALVSNLMISLGLSPKIGHPSFVPRYPGPLPAGLHARLTVRLRRCLIEQIRDVFLTIEQPEKDLEPVNGKVTPKDPTETGSFTIGWFYQEIEAALHRLHHAGKLTFGHADRQVSEWRGPGKLIVIKNLTGAIAALHEITEQGEGASALDPDDGDHELAHYYRFSEIVEGRRIVFDPQHPDGFAYTGEKVPFDPDGVWPMMDDPEFTKYPAGSRAAVLSAQFSRTYQALLQALHRTFDGEPAHLRHAISQMFALDLAAQELMQTSSGLGDGTTAGPSFELPEPR